MHRELHSQYKGLVSSLKNRENQGQQTKKGGDSQGPRLEVPKSRCKKTFTISFLIKFQKTKALSKPAEPIFTGKPYMQVRLGHHTNWTRYGNRIFLRSLKKTSSKPLSSPFSYMAQYLGRLRQHQERRLTEPTLEFFVLLSRYHGNLIQQMKNFTERCPESLNLFANKECAFVGHSFRSKEKLAGDVLL